MDINVVITNGNNNDFVMLTELLDEEFYEIFGDVVKQYEQYNKLKDINDVVIIYNGIEPVACGSFKKYNDSTVEIKRVFVRKEYRKRGFATKIMRKLETIAVKKGFLHGILETGAELNPAIELYKKLGYNTIKNYDQYEKMEVVFA